MTSWNIHPSASKEHEEALLYLAGIDESLVAAFDFCFQEYLHLICINPQLYNLRQQGTRRVNLLPRFSEYYIAYMIWHEKVIILALAHAKRRPYYSNQRIGEAKEMF